MNLLQGAMLGAMGLATLPALVAAHAFSARVTWSPLFAGAGFVVCLAGVVVIRLYQVD